ncbi:hypothetical protein ACKVMT_12845 [Halobacteriales archaeon Cl-PHB]
MTNEGPADGWRRENEQLRESMGLPRYVPPRFAEGTPTHEVVPGLEDRLACSIRFCALNPTYPDDWEVRIDGETAFRVGRHRDGDGNTVYETTAAEFRAAVEDWVRARDE